MKPAMLFSVILFTAIILAASFGLHIMPIEPLYNLGPDLSANALYVCPAMDSVWDSVSAAFRPRVRYINMFFFFTIMLLMSSWGWALYQNLIKDKFDKTAFKNPWAFTKVLFWMAIVAIIMVSTPNSYKTVRVSGSDEKYILCEENTPGALAVKAGAVKR